MQFNWRRYSNRRQFAFLPNPSILAALRRTLMKLNTLSKAPFAIRISLLLAGAAAFAGGATWLGLDLASEPLEFAKTSSAASSTLPTPAVTSEWAKPTSGILNAGINNAAVRPVEPSRTRPAAPAMPSRNSGTHSPRIAVQRVSSPMASERLDRAEQIPTRGSGDNEFVPLIEGRPASPAPVIVEMTPGIPLPAVLLESDQVLSPEAEAMKGRIAQEFEDEISKAADPENSEVNPDDFAAARRRADERYRMFFGDAAYNYMTMSAAKQAVNAAKQNQQK